MPRRRLLGAAAGLVAASRGASAAGDLPPIVVDAHTHFYDPDRRGGVSWPRRDDRLLYRPVLPPEWSRVAAAAGVTATIVIEASRRIEDNQWLLDLCDADRPPVGMHGLLGVVGHLPLGDPACAGLLGRFAANRRFLGIRAGTAIVGRVGDDAAVTDDLARLAERGLTLDVLGPDPVAVVDRAATRLPALRIVVDHMAGATIDDRRPGDEWRVALARIARHANVYLKLSGLVDTPAAAARGAESFAPWIDAAAEAFGERRLLFGSNWPVCTRGGSYADAVAVARAWATARGNEATRWLFCEASRAAYRWKPPTGGDR